MAELKRYGVNRTSSTVKPVGVVPMKGLREASSSLQQFAQTADRFSEFFYEKAAFNAREQAEKDIATAPTDKYQEAFADEENDYVPDANGNPVKADFVSQIPRKDPGLFNNEYNITWNKIAAQRNANNAILTTQGQLDSWYADRMEDLDFGAFEVVGKTYIDSTLSKMDPRIRSSVALKIQPMLQTRYNELRSKKIARDRSLNKDARATIISGLEDQLETGITNYGIDDPGLQQTYMNLADAIYSGVTVGDYSAETAASDVVKVGERMIRGQFIGQINDMLPDGVSPEEDLQMAEIVAAIGTGDLTVKTLRYDADSKSIEIKEVPLSTIMPDATERRALQIDISNIAAKHRDITISQQKLESVAWQNKMMELNNMATIATETGNIEVYDRVVSDMATLVSEINDSDNENKVKRMFEALEYRANIYDRGDKAATERQYLESISEMEKAITPDKLGDVPGYYLDEEDRKAFVSGLPLTNRLKRLTAQHNVLSDYITELSKPAKGQDEFAGYLTNGTGSTNPSKDARNFSDQWLKTYLGVDEIDWKGQSFGVSNAYAAPILKTGIIPPSLGAELTTAIRSGDPERIQNAYKIYERMDNMREYLTKDNIKQQLGSETFRTYEYMRSAIDKAGVFPNDVTFLEKVQNVFNGESILHWKDLDQTARDAATAYIDEQLDPWFGLNRPRFPSKMRNEIYSIIPEAYEEAEGDMKTAGRAAAESAYDQVTKERWGHDDPLMFGKGWVEYPVSKAFPHLPAQGVKNFVRKEIADRIEGDYMFAPNEVAPEGVGTKLMFHGMGADGQAVYKLVRPIVELGGELSINHTEVLDKDGHIVEIDLRPLAHEVSVIMKNIEDTDRMIETLTNMHYRKPSVELRADIAALTVIRNRMTHYPETSLPGITGLNSPIGEIDITWHDESILGGKPTVRRSYGECPPGYQMGPNGCFRAEKEGVHRTELGERTEPQE